MTADDVAVWTFWAGVTVSFISADGIRGTIVLCSGFEIVDSGITKEAIVQSKLNYVLLISVRDTVEQMKWSYCCFS